MSKIGLILRRKKVIPTWVYILIISFALYWNELFTKNYLNAILKIIVFILFLFIVECLRYKYEEE